MYFYQQTVVEFRCLPVALVQIKIEYDNVLAHVTDTYPILLAFNKIIFIRNSTIDNNKWSTRGVIGIKGFNNFE
jgi:hypothetical protein